MNPPHRLTGRALLPLSLALALLGPAVDAQDYSRTPALPRNRYLDGEQTLRAFAPISEATRYSIVKFNVDGGTVALGTVVDTNGLVLTKASQLKKGKLTCWLAVEKEVDAEVLGTDEEEDLALVRVNSPGLKPIQWAAAGVSIGQWAINPGIAETPQSVGIISALSHRIRPPRALIGVQFDFRTSDSRIREVLPGFDAEKAGVKAGDIIVALDNVAVTNREQIIESIRDFSEGHLVKLRLRRAEKEFDAEVRLRGARSAELSADLDPAPRQSRLTGEISRRAEGFELAIEHDSILPPWMCGGPLVNLDGKAVGLNIARADRVSTYALPARLVKQALDSLKTKYRLAAN
jgi:serine protease Do